MEVILYATHAKYLGTIEIVETPAPRLQEMVNTPAMFTRASGTMPANQIVLNDVTIYHGDHDHHVAGPYDQVLIDPNASELVFETSAQVHREEGETHERLTYEKKMAEQKEVRVELVTTGQRKVTGVSAHGARPLTHPTPDRMFFALMDVELEMLTPHASKEELNYILINRSKVESFRIIE